MTSRVYVAPAVELREALCKVHLCHFALPERFASFKINFSNCGRSSHPCAGSKRRIVRGYKGIQWYGLNQSPLISLCDEGPWTDTIGWYPVLEHI